LHRLRPGNEPRHRGASRGAWGPLGPSSGGNEGPVLETNSKDRRGEAGPGDCRLPGNYHPVARPHSVKLRTGGSPIDTRSVSRESCRLIGGEPSEGPHRARIVLCPVAQRNGPVGTLAATLPTPGLDVSVAETRERAVASTRQDRPGRMGVELSSTDSVALGPAPLRPGWPFGHPGN